jgi:hypothetical protein
LPLDIRKAPFQDFILGCALPVASSVTNRLPIKLRPTGRYFNLIELLDENRAGRLAGKIALVAGNGSRCTGPVEWNNVGAQEAVKSVSLLNDGENLAGLFSGLPI